MSCNWNWNRNLRTDGKRTELVQRLLKAVEGGASDEDEVFTSTVPTPSTNTTYLVGNHTYVIPNKATDIADKLTDMQIEIDLLKEKMKKMEKEMKEMNYLLQQWRSSQTGSTNF